MNSHRQIVSSIHPSIDLICLIQIIQDNPMFNSLQPPHKWIQTLNSILCNEIVQAQIIVCKLMPY